MRATPAGACGAAQTGACCGCGRVALHIVAGAAHALNDAVAACVTNGQFLS